MRQQKPEPHGDDYSDLIGNPIRFAKPEQEKHDWRKPQHYAGQDPIYRLGHPSLKVDRPNERKHNIACRNWLIRNFPSELAICRI